MPRLADAPRAVPVSGGRRRDGGTRRFAYADPPYVGMANLYPERTEIDHADLIARLDAEYDGWALHCHVPALPALLPLAPGARVLAWVKPFAVFKPGMRLQYAWEPVLLRPVGPPYRSSVVDWRVSSPTFAGRRLKGAKPEDVAAWVFDAAGLRPGDELVDLYPGTGAIGRAWDAWQRTAIPSSRRRAARSLDLGLS